MRYSLGSLSSPFGRRAGGRRPERWSPAGREHCHRRDSLRLRVASGSTPGTGVLRRGPRHWPTTPQARRSPTTASCPTARPRRWSVPTARCPDALSLQPEVHGHHGAYAGAFGSDSLDASVLMLPLVGFLAADASRMPATIEMVRARLGEGRLVRRWEGDTAGFVICSSWLVECLALSGRIGRPRLGSTRYWTTAATWACSPTGSIAALASSRATIRRPGRTSTW